MKTIYKLICFFTFSLILFSCDDKGEVFSGAPDASSVVFETLQGTISTTETRVVSAQSFPVTITLPKTFPVDVSVEAIAFLPNINKRSRKAFIIKAGETTLTSTMNAPGAEQANVDLPFNQDLNLSLSAFTTAPDVTPKGFVGFQYSIQSNVVTLDYGDSAFGGVNPNRCSVRLDWQYPPNGNPVNNNLSIRLYKDGSATATTVFPVSQTTQPIHGTTAATGRYEVVNFLSTAVDGTYVIHVFAAKLTSLTDPVDVPYRFTVRFPNDDVRTFGGVLPAMLVGAADTAIPKLQIVKSTVDGVSNYVVTSL